MKTKHVPVKPSFRLPDDLRLKIAGALLQREDDIEDEIEISDGLRWLIEQGCLRFWEQRKRSGVE